MADLFARQPENKIEPSLSRVRLLLEILGDPQLSAPVLIVAGTNGKTSTSRMVDTLLRALGLRVGLFTSPHLRHVGERILIDGVALSEERIAAALDDLLPYVDIVDNAERQAGRPPMTFFEVLTVLAYVVFADAPVDVAVMEVGLGGTWDATNVVDSSVAVITNIAIDHVEYLGTPREQIAAEKAGIVKCGATLVLGETDPDLEPFFLAREPARVLRRDRDFGVLAQSLALGGRVVDLSSPEASYPDVYLPLHGRHQADNAAIALAAAEAFVGAPLPPTVVADGFASVRSPGRLEVVGRHPLVLLDGAHNLAGAAALRAALDEEFAAASRTLVVGLLEEKEPHQMLTALGLDDATRLVCCRPPSPRALDPSVLARAAEELGFAPEHVEVSESVRDAIGVALLATPEDGQLVITGSLYTVGAARGVFVKSS